MKNEEFDELVRRKLLNMAESVSDQEVFNVQDYVNKKGKFHFRLKGRIWLFTALPAAAIIGMATWWVLHPNSITQRHDQPVSPPVFKDSVTLPHNEPGGARALNNTEESIIQSDKHEIYSKQKKVMNTVSNKTGTMAVKGKIIRENQKRTEIVTFNTLTNLETSGFLDTIVSQKVFITPESKPNTLKDTSSSLQLYPQKENIPDPAYPLATPVNSAGPDSILQDSWAKPARKSLFPTNFLNKLGIQMGIGLNGSLNSIGSSVYTELFIRQAFGISLGLSYQYLLPEKFADREDFFRHKRRDFNRGISSHLEHSENPRDLSLKGQLISLPVSFSYYRPIGKVIQLSVSAGTAIDLLIYNSMKYTRNFDTLHPEQVSYNAKGRVNPVNHLQLGIGLEKRWDRITLGIKPRLHYYFIEPYNRPKHYNVGLGLNLRYSLK